MDLNIKYIGNDNKYWQKIQEYFLKDYEALDLNFTQVKVNDSFNTKSMFVDICGAEVDILYVDYSVNPLKCLQLCKLLTKNNKTRLISLVGLFEYALGDEYLIKSISASVRINHYKGFEIHDVVYDPISLIDVNMANSPPYVRSRELDQFELRLPLRVGYIGENCFHIETNSYLKVGEIVDISSHPLQDIMPSTKVYVQKFYDNNLYFNTRFAYDLEFIYIDNDYFSSTNKSWLMYKDLKEFPEKLEEMNDYAQADLTADMEKRKEIFAPTKKKIDQWIIDNRDEKIGKSLKILIIDSHQDIFKQLQTSVDEFPYSLNLQTELVGDLYQIQRTLPHLIVFRLDSNINNPEMLERIITKIKSFDAYNPYLLISNCTEDSEELRKSQNYKNCMSYPGTINVDEIKVIAKTLDEKLEITNSETKVFLKLRDQKSIMFLKKNVHVLGMTESILYFESKLEIPMWTVFIVEKPIKMLLTIVPHKEDGHFKSEKNIYRAIINGVGEKEKAQIRQLINLSFKEEEA
jgi:hypothetical protein